MLQRSTLHHREHGLVDRLGVLGPRQDHRAARTSQRLVRGKGHHVGVRHRTGIGSACHQADEVRGVHHQDGLHLVGDAPERREVDRSGVGRVPGQDDLGAVLAGEGANAVHVEQLALPVHLVADE